MEDARASTPIADRYWLLTWTTYGSWMPGDERGFVSRHPDETGEWILNNIPGVPPDSDLPEWKEASRSRMIGPPVFLDRSHAESILAQVQETTVFRGWLLLAAAIMRNHVHLVIGVPGDPDPAGLLRDTKSYASRALNRRWGKPESGTWWSESGSRRKLSGEDAVLAAIHYVKNQEYPLRIWIHEEFA